MQAQMQVTNKLHQKAPVPRPCARPPRTRTRALNTRSAELVDPQYAELDAQPLNKVVMGLFRRKMVQAIGSDVPVEG